VECIGNRTLTRADRKDLATETNKSAITDHVAKENHITDWSGAKILDRENHQRTTQLKESIYICKEANCMNRDGEPTTYQRSMIVFWSRAHCQCCVTICLMKFAVSKRNVAIKYSFCIWLYNGNVVITVNTT